MRIPFGYLPVMPYLIVDDAAAFLRFSKKVLGAKEQTLVSDPNDYEKIRHGEIRIHDAVIMFGQANENWGIKSAGMFLYVENVDAVFKAASGNGATILMEPGMQEYGYSAGFEDPFGNHWWITQGVDDPEGTL